MLAENIGDNPGAVTRFVLVSRPGALPEPTGADKTTVVVPLPEDRPGALMEILDQFATRGVNLSRIESRPTGQYLGHYFFSIDADGHVADARVADALAGPAPDQPGHPLPGFLRPRGRQAPWWRRIPPTKHSGPHMHGSEGYSGGASWRRNGAESFAHSVDKCPSGTSPPSATVRMLA